MPIDLDNLFDQDGNPVDPGDLDLGSDGKAHAKARVLEREKAELQAQADRAATLERENAFLKAGVPLESDDPNSREAIFMRGYQGEHTADSIREAFNSFLGNAPDTRQPSQVAAAAAGANPNQVVAGQQPFESDPEGYRVALANAGGNQDKVLATMREWGSPVADFDD
jgi:hypothetical protein